MRPRHKLVTEILRVFLSPYCRLRYGIKVSRFKEQQKRPYLILMNHQTPFDQFFVGMAFKGPIYYLATEDIFSNGWISSIIRYLVAPIPIKKQTTDIKAILNCIRVSREGGTIALAPEGNRTYSGRTEYMSPSIVPLAKKLGVPIVLFRIEGGYGVEPRWSDVIRKGKMKGYVSRVIPPEEYASMTDDQLYTEIKDGLYVNEANANGEFRHKRLAEYLERAVYICPFCGLSAFESNRDIIECKSCHRQIRYTKHKELIGVGFDFPFRFVADWYDYQLDYVNALDVTALTEKPIYLERARALEVIPCEKKNLVADNAAVSLYGDRIVLDLQASQLCFEFDSTSAVTVLGRNKLNIYSDGKIYQLKGDKRFNALKFVHIYHRYKNIKKGDENNAFLGL